VPTNRRHCRPPGGEPRRGAIGFLESPSRPRTGPGQSRQVCTVTGPVVAARDSSYDSGALHGARRLSVGLAGVATAPRSMPWRLRCTTSRVDRLPLDASTHRTQAHERDRPRRRRRLPGFISLRVSTPSHSARNARVLRGPAAKPRSVRFGMTLRWMSLVARPLTVRQRLNRTTRPRGGRVALGGGRLVPARSSRRLHVLACCTPTLAQLARSLRTGRIGPAQRHTAAKPSAASSWLGLVATIFAPAVSSARRSSARHVLRSVAARRRTPPPMVFARTHVDACRSQRRRAHRRRRAPRADQTILGDDDVVEEDSLNKHRMAGERGAAAATSMRGLRISTRSTRAVVLRASGRVCFGPGRAPGRRPGPSTPTFCFEHPTAFDARGPVRGTPGRSEPAPVSLKQLAPTRSSASSSAINPRSLLRGRSVHDEFGSVPNRPRRCAGRGGNLGGRNIRLQSRAAAAPHRRADPTASGQPGVLYRPLAKRVIRCVARHTLESRRGTPGLFVFAVRPRRRRAGLRRVYVGRPPSRRLRGAIASLRACRLLDATGVASAQLSMFASCPN